VQKSKISGREGCIHGKIPYEMHLMFKKTTDYQELKFACYKKKK